MASLSLACVTSGAGTSTLGPSWPYCSFSRSLGNGEEEDGYGAPPTPTKGSIYPDEGLKPLHRAITDWCKTAGSQGQHNHGEELLKPEAFSLEKHQTLHPLTFVRAPRRSSTLSEMD